MRTLTNPGVPGSGVGRSLQKASQLSQLGRGESLLEEREQLPFFKPDVRVERLPEFAHLLDRHITFRGQNPGAGRPHGTVLISHTSAQRLPFALLGQCRQQDRLFDIEVLTARTIEVVLKARDCVGGAVGRRPPEP